MNLTLDKSTIPPRPLSHHEAARMLMGKKHLVIVGVGEIPEHRRLFEDAMILLSGQCSYLNSNVAFVKTDSPKTKFFVSQQTDPGAAEFISLFVPDSLNSRAILLVLVAQYCPSHVKALIEIENPIVLLGDPAHEKDDELQTGYACLCMSMEALTKGEAIDTTSN